MAKRRSKPAGSPAVDAIAAALQADNDCRWLTYQRLSPARAAAALDALRAAVEAGDIEKAIRLAFALGRADAMSRSTRLAELLDCVGRQKSKVATAGGDGQRSKAAKEREAAWATFEALPQRERSKPLKSLASQLDVGEKTLRSILAEHGITTANRRGKA